MQKIKIILIFFLDKAFHVFRKILFRRYSYVPENFIRNTFHIEILWKTCFKKIYAFRKVYFENHISESLFQNIFHVFQKFCFENFISKISLQKFCKTCLEKFLEHVIQKSLSLRVKWSLRNFGNTFREIVGIQEV